jgi:hypothetical protein
MYFASESWSNAHRENPYNWRADKHLFLYSTEVDIFEYLKINRVSLSRNNTRAGFETPTVFAPLKELSSLNTSGLPLSSVGAAHTIDIRFF